MAEDEIDLVEIYRHILKTKFFSKIKNTFTFISKNITWFFIFFIVGAVLGYFIHINQDSRYKSTLIIESNHIDVLYCEEIVLSLNKLIQEKNVSEFKRLDLNSEIINKISHLNFHFLHIEYDDEPQKERLNSFKIEIVAKTNDSWSEIEEHILKYLRSNKYAIRNLKSTIKYSKERETKIMKEISKIDSIQSIVMNKLANASGNSKSIIKIPSFLTREKIENEFKLIGIQQNLEQVKNMRVVTSVTPSITPLNKSVFPIFITIFLTTIIGGLFLKLIKK